MTIFKKKIFGKKSLLFITAILSQLVWWQPAIATPSRLLVNGTAEDIKTGKVVYREYHDISQQKHTVSYFDLSDNLIASKEIHYVHGYNTPEYTLYDKRFDRHTGSQWQDGHFIIFKQEGTHAKHEKKLQSAADLVIDAGFDHFIRSKQDVLADGEVLPFTFAVADPLMTLDMKLEEVSRTETAIKLHNDDKNTNSYRFYLVQSRNRLIGWAIPDINLAYDDTNHFLQVYQGLSNITDKHDKSQTVIIRYQYPNLAIEGSKP